MSTLWCCPGSVSSVDHGVAHPPECLEEWFWRSCHGVWHAQPCKFPSLDSYQKRFLWTHKEVDLAPHLVIGLVFHVGHAEIFPHALGFESLESFFESISNQCPCFTAIEEDEGNKRLTGTCLRSLIVLLCQILFNLAIAEAILIRISAEQVSSLHRAAPKYLKLITFCSFCLLMLVSALMLFVLLVMILFYSVLVSIPYALALSTSLLVRSWSLHLLPSTRSMSSANRSCLLAFHRERWMCGGHGVFPAWSSLGTSWRGWVRVSIPDRHLLLSWKVPLADCWSSRIVPKWLEPVLPLCNENI